MCKKKKISLLLAIYFFSIASLVFGTEGRKTSEELFKLQTTWSIIGRENSQWAALPHELTKPILLDEIIVFGSVSGFVSAYHKINGYLKWKIKLPGAIQGALSYGRSKIFVGDNKGNLYCLKSINGSIEWKFKTGSEFYSPPLLVRDQLFVSSAADEIFAIDARTGKQIWYFSERGDEKITVRATSAPIHYGSELFIGFSNGSVVCLSLENGKVIWSKKLVLPTKGVRFYDVDTVPYVDSNYVIFGAFDGKIHCLSRLNGTTVWIHSSGAFTGFLVDESSIYFSGLDGNFYALEKGTGKEKWKQHFRTGIGLTPAKLNTLLLISTSSDPIYLLDLKTGKIELEKALGTGSFASLVADSQENQIYAISNYGNFYSFKLIKNNFSPPLYFSFISPSALYFERK